MSPLLNSIFFFFLVLHRLQRPPCCAGGAGEVRVPDGRVLHRLHSAQSGAHRRLGGRKTQGHHRQRRSARRC